MLLLQLLGPVFCWLYCCWCWPAVSCRLLYHQLLYCQPHGLLWLAAAVCLTWMVWDLLLCYCSPSLAPGDKSAAAAAAGILWLSVVSYQLYRQNLQYQQYGWTPLLQRYSFPQQSCPRCCRHCHSCHCSHPPAVPGLNVGWVSKLRQPQSQSDSLCGER